MEGVETNSGSSALNSARATDFMLSNQGQEVQVVGLGSVGKDDNRMILENALSDVEMIELFYKDTGVAIGTCGVVVHEKD